MQKKTIAVLGVVAVVIIAALAAIVLSSGGNSATTTITESGSTTMAEMSASWAQEFKNETGIQVTISTPGSGPGIDAFVAGKVNIAQASRTINSTEVATAKANGLNVTQWTVAVDGIAMIVNPDVPVKNITVADLAAIYEGNYTNWNQVPGLNGPNQQIVLVGREAGSGTYTSFENLVLGNGNYASSMQQESSNAAIVPIVESTKGAIGYVGIGYAEQAGSGVGILNVQKNATAPAYSPLNKTAVYDQLLNKTGYPLSRYLYLYTNGVPTNGSAQYKWISFVLSSQGQQVVTNTGFYQLDPSDMSQMQALLATAK